MWQEDVCYVGIVAWNKLAESCNQRLNKGSAVLVEGELQTRNWKSEDGSQRSVLEVKARRIQFLNKYPNSNGGPNAQANGHQTEDEDLFDFFSDNNDDDTIGKYDQEHSYVSNSE